MENLFCSVNLLFNDSPSINYLLQYANEVLALIRCHVTYVHSFFLPIRHPTRLTMFHPNQHNPPTHLTTNSLPFPSLSQSQAFSTFRFPLILRRWRPCPRMELGGCGTLASSGKKAKTPNAFRRLKPESDLKPTRPPPNVPFLPTAGTVPFGDVLDAGSPSSMIVSQ